MRIPRQLLIGLFAALFSTLQFSCECRDCAITAATAIFVATFENDTIGQPPDPTRTYGPPGASLVATGSVQVVNDAGLGSKSMRIERGTSGADIVFGFGDTELVNACNMLYIDIRLRGEVIPSYAISGAAFSVLSLNGKAALYLKLFGGSYSYYDRTSSSYKPISGSYNPSQAHNLRLILDPRQKVFSVCINNVDLLCNEPFYDPLFDVRSSFKISLPKPITEAFESVLVVDKLRVIQ